MSDVEFVDRPATAAILASDTPDTFVYRTLSIFLTRYSGCFSALETVATVDAISELKVVAITPSSIEQLHILSCIFYNAR